MSSLQGLPPLPRSLSGFNLSRRGENGEPPPPPTRSSSKSQRGDKPSSSRPSPPARQLTTLDTQLAVLRREMVLHSRESFALSFASNAEKCGLVTLFGGNATLYRNSFLRKNYIIILCGVRENIGFSYDFCVLKYVSSIVFFYVLLI